MANTDEELIINDLAIAATKPAMLPVLGIPYKDSLFFAMAALECFIMGQAQLLLLLLPIFLFSITLYKRDYNAGRVFIGWVAETGRMRLAAIFGWILLIRPQDRAAASYAFNFQAIRPRPHDSFRGMISG